MTVFISDSPAAGSSPSIVAVHSNAYGQWTALFTPKGLAGIWFPNDGNAPPCTEGENPLRTDRMDNWIRETFRTIDLMLTVPRTGHELTVPMDLGDATDFQRKVWEALLRIPAGEVRTYQEIGRDLNMPGASRAVGNACGRNPIPLLIPCHRVRRSDGSLGGFSAGIEWKKILLRLENSSGTQSAWETSSLNVTQPALL